MTNSGRNNEKDSQCRCCTFCEMSFTLFCSLVYLSLYYPIVFQKLFENTQLPSSTNTTVDVTNYTLQISENITVNNASNICRWSEWGECDTPCGIGQQTRVINTPPCNFITETRDCYSECEPCSVSEWSEWSNCTALRVVSTCIAGLLTRTRSIQRTVFCDDNISVPLYESEQCYHNCTQEELSELSITTFSAILPQENIKVPKISYEESTEAGEVEEDSSSVLTIVLVSIGLLFTLIAFAYQKGNIATLTIKPPGITTSKNNLDSPCERGQLMMLNPLMDFKSLKIEFTKATRLDKERKYAEAYTIYLQGSAILLSMRENETNLRQRKVYTDYARSYIQRAEDIERRYPFKIKKIKHNVNNFPLKVPTINSLTVKKKPTNTKIPNNSTSMVVGKHTYSPRRSSALKPPPPLSKTCELETSDCEGSTRKQKPKCYSTFTTKRDYSSESSASSSDGDGDDKQNHVSKPTKPTRLGNKVLQNVLTPPPKETRDKIKTEFPPRK